MKRIYMRPTAEVVHLKMQQQLLAGSGGRETETPMDFGGDAGENDEAGARGSFHRGMDF